MSEMVERVARAICRSNCSPRMSRDHIECQVENAWDMWIPEARAAIEAMRSQTLVYLDNGKVVHEMRGAPDDIWKTLLDAALGDG